MRARGIHVLVLLFLCAAPMLAQTQQAATSTPTFRASTRMVVVDVVAKDHAGHHVTGLKTTDFQVVEQNTQGKKEKRPEKIAAFSEVNIADLRAQTSQQPQVPADVYTNAVTLQANPIPPTIILLDGLNTDVQDQLQVHAQMVRMLKALPADVPTAVFLLGHRLRMLQDFTTDPALLQAALKDASTTAGQGQAKLDPRDDPDSASAFMDLVNGGMARSSQGSDTAPAGVVSGAGAPPTKPPVISQLTVDAVKRFEQAQYGGQMDERIRETAEALISIARHVAGYPGRKNLLWISSSFPISLSLDSELRDYSEQVKNVANALSDAKVAVYPVNPGGVATPGIFEADARPRDLSPRGFRSTLGRETSMHDASQDTMEAVAEGTGGTICVGSNDLANCVRRAIDDSSEFYELAYYPDSQDWNGEYHKIIVKTTRPGVRLSYRNGYFASSERAADPKTEKQKLQQAACEDYLNATSIVLAAKSLPADSADRLKYLLMINTAPLTFTSVNGDTRAVDLDVSVCTFDRKGDPIRFESGAFQRNFTAGEYQALAAAPAILYTISVPGPKPAAVRLLVRDIPSGRLGTLAISLH